MKNSYNGKYFSFWVYLTFIMENIMTNKGTYRTALDKRIKAGRVFLNDKTKLVSSYDETTEYAVVKVGKNYVILTEDDVLIIT